MCLSAILILSGKADRNVNRQSFLMKGVVTDEDGESIIGATVMIGGTSKGTVTDINGQYSISVLQTMHRQVHPPVLQA